MCASGAQEELRYEVTFHKSCMYLASGGDYHRHEALNVYM